MFLSGFDFFPIKLSLQVAFVATFFVVIAGTALAYLLATKKFRGKTLLEVLITLPLILPPTVTGYYLILLFGRQGIVGKYFEWNLTFTWGAAVIASFVVSLPLMVRTAQAAIESVDRSMINTSYMLGYGKWQTAFKVIFPLARKGLLAGTILSFARAMGEFGATLMFAGNIPGRTNTMPLEIYSLASSGDWTKAHVLVLILTLGSILILVLATKLARKDWS